MNFTEKLIIAARKKNSLLCVGLDPDPELMPANVGTLQFNKKIIDATSDLVCAYKLNFAFYEALGDTGFNILKQTVDYIPSDIAVIADAKRGDIGSTAKAYAKSIFNNLNFDATTVNPYLGFDSILPFTRYRDKGIFILCRTSNPGAVDFQSLSCEIEGQSYRLFELVARKAAEWNKYANIGLVVGATYPEELRLIRKSHPDIPLLIPGIGAQGGNLEQAVAYGVDAHGEKAILSSSRQIIYAARGDDFAEAARKVAAELRDEINSYRANTSSR